MDKEIVFELRKSVPGHVFREKMTRSALRRRTGSHERVFISREEEEEHERPRHEEYRTTKITRSRHKKSGSRDSGRGHLVSRKTRNGDHRVSVEKVHSR